jgi:hypothetical protein
MPVIASISDFVHNANPTTPSRNVDTFFVDDDTHAYTQPDPDARLSPLPPPVRQKFLPPPNFDQRPAQISRGSQAFLSSINP